MIKNSESSGITDRRGGWKWLDGTSADNAWTNWYDNEPNEKELCVRIQYSDGQWLWRGRVCNFDDYKCICEKVSHIFIHINLT